MVLICCPLFWGKIISAPDGYKSSDQLATEREAKEKTKKTLAAQKRRIETGIQGLEQHGVKRAKIASQKLRELEKEHNTTDEIRRQRQILKEQIKLTDPKSLRLQTILQNCQLLKVEKGVATFVCFNKVTQKWLQTEFTKLIIQKLQAVNNNEIKDLATFFVSLNDD